MPRVGLWGGVAVTAAVAAIGLFWFVERLVASA
jgi:hypothetical protein